MLSFLRFFGVTVAAVWFGATFFFTFFAGPAFFTDEMKRLFPPPYNGTIAELVIARLFVLHYLCGLLALAHVGAEWMYSGKEPPRFTVWLVGGALGVSLLGGVWLQPKLKLLHQVKYAEHYRLAATSQQRADAAKAFSTWHGVSMGMNLVTLLALWVNLARVIRTGEAPRFVSPINKFGIDKRT
ncbi:MAG: DUF4149 domain-containing protein [Limisphaerales bacterium]